MRKLLVKRKIQDKRWGKTRVFLGPIRALREALDLSQEAAARQIGVSTYTWAGWEQGKAGPPPAQLDAIAGLASDPALRMKFWLDIYQEGIKLGAPSQEKMTPREVLFTRYVNDIVMAARELCIAAASGSTASEEMLRHAADQLIRAAGDAERARKRAAGQVQDLRRPGAGNQES